MNLRFKHFLKYQFPAILWAFVIFIGSSIPAKYIPSYKIFTYDKLIHIGLFLIFGLFVYRSLEPFVKKNYFSWARAFFSVSIVVLYGVLDELHQGSVPGRTLEIWDAVADTVGGILSATFLYLHYVYRTNSSKRV